MTPRRRRPIFESLEPRQLLSITPVGPIVNLNLLIQGTYGDDAIALVQGGTAAAPTVVATVNGVATTYDFTKYLSLSVNGLAGNDAIDCSKLTTIGVTVRGGVGDDVIRGGGGNDTLYGGAGNGNAFDESGKDTVYGNGGNDRLFASTYAAATLDGGAGNDTIRGYN
ncbi:MAG TPA: hypothetical protein VF796_16190, partial [Humisphaera sp.]